MPITGTMSPLIRFPLQGSIITHPTPTTPPPPNTPHKTTPPPPHTPPTPTPKDHLCSSRWRKGQAPRCSHMLVTLAIWSTIQLSSTFLLSSTPHLDSNISSMSSGRQPGRGWQKLFRPTFHLSFETWNIRCISRFWWEGKTISYFTNTYCDCKWVIETGT